MSSVQHGSSCDLPIFVMMFLYQSRHPCVLTGLFELRVQEYLESIHENENRRVNRFLKGLGEADLDF